MPNDIVVSKLNSAKLALAQAKTIQETKKILDIAVAAKIYAQRQKLGEESISYANAIKIEALKRLGEMLKESPRHKQEMGRPKISVPNENAYLKLADIGIDRKTSMIAQQITGLSLEQFESVKTGHVAVAKALKDAQSTRNRAEKIKTLSKPHSLDLVGRFHVLYCDPPWEYEHVKTENRSIENHYPTMPLKAIQEIPVHKISMDDSVLFLWATSPKLKEAMSVIDAWGFNYRTCAVWDKEVMGMGYYFRQQHEMLFVATKGSLPVPLPSVRQSSVIRSRRGKHSEKPEVVYKIIESMYPTISKVELFSRVERSGWSSWGNEVGTN